MVIAIAQGRRSEPGAVTRREATFLFCFFLSLFLLRGKRVERGTAYSDVIRVGPGRCRRRRRRRRIPSPAPQKGIRGKMAFRAGMRGGEGPGAVSAGPTFSPACLAFLVIICIHGRAFLSLAHLLWGSSLYPMNEGTYNPPFGITILPCRVWTGVYGCLLGLCGSLCSFYN